MNIDKKLDNKGFTLAELLITVAIIVILLAVAIPSILSLQRNLLLDDANNAAEAVANAAQLEMTSMKTDGTWASSVRNNDGSYKSDFPAAINVGQPSSGASSSHMRYMTAKTARDFGIISDLSVEQSVRDASYIIEFDGLTASVTRVYYTTGATGFFNVHVSADNADKSVLDYYKSAPGEDDQTARRSFESCTIGKYAGTPDGATPSAALLNPSVSANEYGKIVLTNPNMRDAGDVNSTIKDLETQVTFTYPISDSQKYSFTISGMTKNYSGDTYVVKASDGVNEYTCSFSNAPASKTSIYTVESNSLIELDLNDLASLLEDHKDESQIGDVWRIVSEIQDASRKDLQSKMETVCIVSAKDCMPVSGKAFLDWPSKVPTLKVYVTDPDPKNTDVEALGMDKTAAVIPDYISGTYTSPGVTLVDQSGNPVDPSIIGSYTGLISDSMLKASFALKGAWVNNEAGNATKLPVKEDWFNILENENVQEGSQSYSGKTIKIDTARGISANVLVTVGSYASNDASHMTITNNNSGTITYSNGSVTKTKTNAFKSGEVKWLDSAKEQGFSGQKHDYQIFEVWLDDGVSNHRVGSFQGKEWVWDDDDGILSDCVRAAEGGNITENTTQLIVDSEALMSKAGVLSKYQNYSLYVRTAPKSSEALSWFNDHAYELASYVGTGSGTSTDQRGQNYGRPVRWLFENEFGASTTVAAYTVSTIQQTNDIMKDKGGQVFPLGNTYFRAYYSTLPAVAWNTSSASDPRYLELPNAQMMLYKFTKGEGVEQVAFDTGNTIYSWELDNPFQVRATAGADIAIVTTLDQQFYRVLTYFDNDGKTRLSDGQLSDNQQYRILPLDGFDDDLRFPEGPQKSGMAFYGWRVTSSSGNFDVTCDENGVMPLVSDYVDQMKYGAVSLTALYREGCDEKVGLVYVDNYDNGAWSYTGQPSVNAAYADDKYVDAGTVVGTLDSGYYVSYKVGTSTAPKVDLAGSASAWGGSYSVSETSSAQANFNGERYALYKVDFDPSCDTQAYTTVRCKMVGQKFPSAYFYCNSLFGGMITSDELVAQAFGRSSYPWRVYNTDMFPGVFQSTMQDDNLAYLRTLLENNNTFANSTNHYVQMRNLDFGSLVPDSLQEWPVAFRGTYDGQGHDIANAQNALTTITVSGGGTVSTLGKVNNPSGPTVQDAMGLFPCICGKDINGNDKSNPASISNLNIKVGDCSSSASLFGVVSGIAINAVFDGIEVVGADAQDSANVVLEDMGKYGTADVVYGSGAIVGRAQKCFYMQNCSASDIDFSIKDAMLDLTVDNRNAFGGLAGVFDVAPSSASEILNHLRSLSVENISCDLNSTQPAGKAKYISMGGLFGRLYFSGNVTFADMEWSVKDFSILNNSSYDNAVVYPGIIAGSYGGSPKLYDGICSSEGIAYVADGKSYDLLKVFLSKRTVGAGGLLSGTEWFFLNNKKNASQLIEEAGKLRSTPSTASDDTADDSSSSQSSSSSSVASSTASSSVSSSTVSAAIASASSSSSDSSTSSAPGSSSSSKQSASASSDASSSSNDKQDSSSSSSGAFSKVDDAA